MTINPIKRAPPPLGSRTWKPEEDQYLQDKWGQVSMETIAGNLGRTVNAVKVRAHRLSLGPFIESGEYISLNQLLVAVKGTNAGGSYALKSWVENRGLPVHTRKVNTSSIRVVYLDEFWKWAEKNRSFLDFSKMEPLALGKEPEWVIEQRRKDFRAFAIQRKDPWTSDEDSRLKMLLKQHKYGYAELSDMLNRSAGAIQRRCTDLGLKERPVKADNHSAWTEADYQVLADGIRCGDSYTMIGREIGKSEKAVRGKVYSVYLTENQDKVRAMMGDGLWGDGAPVPTVKQAVNLSWSRRSTKEDLARLCGVLQCIAKQRIQDRKDYDHYWQRSMCMKWNELKGICDAGCDECDSCAEFQRIQPQYCVRCGVTFFERKENKVCSRCRDARLRSARKKYAVLEKRRSAE